MGNYKFKFSNMIPNAWFHKLKNMNNTTKTLNHSKQKHSSLHSPEKFTISNQRKSYYFTRDLALVQPISPSKPATAAQPSTKPSRRRHRRPTQPRQFSTSAPDNSSECTNSGPDQSSLSEPDSVLTEYGSDRDPCKSNDIVTDTGKSDDQCRRLPPIITRKTAPSASPVRRLPSLSAGIKLRVNSSPRLAVHGRRSMAVVKASKDPRQDFRESMVEMISQYKIRESNDLEELLACYLLLNSDEHHHLIINVFKQIWFDFIHLRLKFN